MLTARIVDNEDDLGGISGSWDALASESEQPYCSPAWMLAWWRHLRPRDAELRVVAVEDGDRLVGVLPMFDRGGRSRLLGDAVGTAEPLAAPGRAEEVAGALGAQLGTLAPRLRSLRVEYCADGPRWPELLQAEAPQGPALLLGQRTALPRVDLGAEGFDGWLASRERRFRQEVRRRSRRLEEHGARFRLADEDSVDRDVEDLIRLHELRFGEGRSRLTDPRMIPCLCEVAAELLPAGRFRLVVLEHEGTAIAAQLMIVAGGKLTGLVGGFDAAYAKFQPAVACIVHALEDMAGRGEHTLVLGPGEQPYKRALATDLGCLESATLLAPGLAGRVERARIATSERLAAWLIAGRSQLGAARRRAQRQSA